MRRSNHFLANFSVLGRMYIANATGDMTARNIISPRRITKVPNIVMVSTNIGRPINIINIKITVPMPCAKRAAIKVPPKTTPSNPPPRNVAEEPTDWPILKLKLPVPSRGAVINCPIPVPKMLKTSTKKATIKKDRLIRIAAANIRGIAFLAVYASTNPPPIA